MVSKKGFRCQRCGDCCKLVVKLSLCDIKRIEKSGYKREYFLASDPMIAGHKKDVLRMIGGRCIFSYKNNDKYLCGIYRIRPRYCRIYPFFIKEVDSCKPDRLLKWW